MTFEKHILGKKLHIDHEKEFPLVMNDTLGIDKASTMLHWHDEIEICYIKHGTGIYLIGGREYPFSQGDIFVINSRDIHLAYNDKEVIMQVLTFESRLFWNGAGFLFEMECLVPFWEAGISYNNRLDRENAYYTQVVDILKGIEDEMSLKSSAYKISVKSLLLRLSSVLIRYLDIKEDGKSGERLKNYNRLEPVFHYIESHYPEKIKLEDMAALMNMSSSNFSLTFKKTVGISPMDYLIRERIVKASEMLLETDSKVIEISLSCGFFSMSNFIEIFKKFTGKSPSEFRQIRDK